MQRESYSAQQVDALRRGDLAGCFGRRFEGIGLADSLHLPDGRMRLILLRAMGAAEVVDDVSDAELHALITAQR